MTPGRGAPESFTAPWRLFARVLLVIVLAETLVVTLLELVKNDSRDVPGIVEAGLVALVCAPFLWWAIARPLRGVATVAHARAAAVIEHAIDGIITINEQGVIELFNPSAARIFGYQPEEIIGQPVTCLMPLRYRDAHRMAVARARGTGEAHLIGKTVELAGLRKDGTEFPLECSLARWTPGEKTFFTAAVRDITERKRAAEALRQSTAQYEGLFNQMLNGFGVQEIICDEAGRPCDYRFVAVNPAFERLTGLKAADLVGKTVRQVLPGIEPFWIETLGRVAQTGKPVHFEHYASPLERHYEVFAFSPQQGQVAAVFADVSDYLRLESQLRQAQKLEALGQLTSTIAHDFNNILAVILGNAQLAASARGRDRAPPIAELGEIEAAAKRGASLVKRLLGFSRESALSLRPVDLSQLVAEEVTTLRRLVPEHIAVATDTEGEVGPVSADPTAVEQILLNLVTNARDAMPHGGALRISVGAATLGDDPELLPPGLAPGEYSWLSVSDTGVGMDEQTKSRIFDPFFTTKPPGQGTGLGMAVVHGLVRQHGGFVQVASRPGAGSTVTVYLPIIQGETAGAAPGGPDDPVSRGHGETILVVEDEAPLRNAAGRVLETLGYRVRLAGDGEEALRVFAEHEGEIDLVFSDVVMPRLGGWQLYQALRARSKRLRFICTSGYADEWRAGEGLAVGEAGDLVCVNKPWTIGELARAVRHELDKLVGGRAAPGSPAETPAPVELSPRQLVHIARSSPDPH